MIESYVKELESLKKTKTSELIEKIFIKATYFIHSQYSSDKIKKYFDFTLSDVTIEQIHALIHDLYAKRANQADHSIPRALPALQINEEIELHIKAMLLQTNMTGSPLVPLKLDEELITQLKIKELISQIIEHNNLDASIGSFDLTPKHIEKIEHLITQANNARFPYKNFEQEPSNISQIKKWMNALHYMRLTFIDLENIDTQQQDTPPQNTPDGGFMGGVKKAGTLLQNAGILYQAATLLPSTIDAAYEACFLAVDWDINLQEMFYPEFISILHQAGLLKNILNQYFAQDSLETIQQHPEEQPPKLIDQILWKYPILPYSYKAGTIAGAAIEQMRPISREVDYSFLTQFSAKLPAYIESLTQIIRKGSSQFSERQPKLNQEKLNEIRTAALDLLNDIENVQAGSLLNSVKSLKYIHIIRNIITLSLTTLEQVNELNDSSQDVIREKIHALKFDVILPLFTLVDKFEINSVLSAGSISNQLMKKIKDLYGTILFLPRKILDFNTKGEDLLVIEDARFVEIRLEKAHKRIDKENKTLDDLRDTEKTLNDFFTQLKAPEYANKTLQQLPEHLKHELAEHYKLIQPYAKRLSPVFNNMMLQSLLEPDAGRSYLSWMQVSTPQNHIQLILKQQEQLSALITKDRESALFQIELNRDLIRSIQTHSELHLFPYDSEKDIYRIDERSFLQPPEKNEPEAPEVTKIQFKEEDGSILVSNHEALNAIQSFQRAQGYLNKYNKLTEVNDAYEELIAIIKAKNIKGTILNFTNIDRETRNILRLKYNQIQPWFLFAAPPDTIALIIELDRVLSGIFSKKANATLTKNELLTLKTDLLEYTALINQGANPHAKKLTLNGLNEAKKIKLHALHDKIHASIPSLASIAPPAQEKFCWQLERHLTALFNNQEVSIDDVLNCADFNVLAQKCTESLSGFIKQVELKEYARFDIEQKKVIVSEQLTISDVLSFYEENRNKRNNPPLIEAEYKKFITTLKTQPLTSSLRALEDLDEIVKKNLFSAYRRFQPHFLNTIASALKEDASVIGKYLVAVLSGFSVEMLTDNKEFKRKFTTKTQEWHNSYLKYSELAKEKRQQELTEYKLPKAGEDTDRHLLDGTKYIKYIHQIKDEFDAIKFNQTIKNQLIPQQQGVPYPEMEYPDLQLAQSKQIRAIKQIYNCLYHLEAVILSLSKLTDDNLRGGYIKILNIQKKKAFVDHLRTAYDHINKIIQLTNHLARDPHFGVIAKHLMHQMQTIYSSFLQHTEAYQISHETVLPTDGIVQYNPLWYILNGFFIIPPHIKAFKNDNPIPATEVEKLNKNAKRATLIIEGLIHNSDSYFKLFLKTPEMLELYKKLGAKLNEFMTTTHDTVLEKLSKVRSHVFTPMLTEADGWERNIGLTAGTISEPLQKIINEFYKGALNQLHLLSAVHIHLICDPEPLKERIQSTEECIAKAQNKLDLIKTKYQDLNALYMQIQEYKKHTNSSFFERYIYRNRPDQDEQIAFTKEQIKELYRKALPIIAKLKAKKYIEIPPAHYSAQPLDQLCKEAINPYDLQLTEVERWITASFMYSEGLIATQEMHIKSARERLTYLTSLIKIEQDQRQQFIDEYIDHAFERHLKEACSRYIGLQYIKEEYLALLGKELNESKDEIVHKAQSAEDINLCIKVLLKEKVGIFETQHYTNYYHLESVHAALTQFQNYFNRADTQIISKTSVYENKHTLNKKIARIEKLHAVAKDSTKSVTKRIEEIKILVQDPGFKSTIFAHKGEPINHYAKQHRDDNPELEPEINSPSSLLLNAYNYLKRCFLNLLEVLHLYTPTRKKLFHNIHDAVNTTPEINNLITRFSLFAHPKMAQEESLDEEINSTPGMSTA